MHFTWAIFDVQFCSYSSAMHKNVVRLERIKDCTFTWVHQKLSNQVLNPTKQQGLSHNSSAVTKNSTQMCCPVLSSTTLTHLLLPTLSLHLRHEMKHLRMLCEPLPSDTVRAWMKGSPSTQLPPAVSLSFPWEQAAPDTLTWGWMFLHCSKPTEDKAGHTKFRAPACWAGRNCCVELNSYSSMFNLTAPADKTSKVKNQL